MLLPDIWICPCPSPTGVPAGSVFMWEAVPFCVWREGWTQIWFDYLFPHPICTRVSEKSERTVARTRVVHCRKYSISSELMFLILWNLKERKKSHTGIGFHSCKPKGSRGFFFSYNNPILPNSNKIPVNQRQPKILSEYLVVSLASII